VFVQYGFLYLVDSEQEQINCEDGFSIVYILYVLIPLINCTVEYFILTGKPGE
jgi:hypothetical protein